MKNCFPDFSDSGRELQQALQQARRVQQQLEKNNRRLEEAQKLARLGYLECKVTGDEEPRFYDVSHNLFDIFDVSNEFAVDEPIGVEQIYALICNEDKSRIRSSFAQALQSASHFEESFRITRPSDSRVYYLHARLDVRPYGEGYRIVGFVMDITEKALLEQQVLNASKMDAIGRLAGGITHDFNNILQVILGCGKNLLQALEKESSESQYAQMIVSAGEKARVLVRQLLLFSQPKKPKFEYIALNSYITEISRLIKRLIGENIQLTLKLSADLMTVKAYFDQIEQMVMNLCVNSRDAMPSGGEIVIETQNAVLPDDKESKYVLVKVSDTGCGIDEDIIHQIYEPFFTTKQAGRGTGLGLANTDTIAKNHGGFIECSSIKDKGTTFSIYLPAVSGEPQPPETSQPEFIAIRAAETRTILLAEDDMMVRELTVDTLKEAGYQVILADDGDQAIELFRENNDKIDMLILDVIMPGKSGREVYDTICNEYCDIPVLFCSGYDRNTLKEDYLLTIGGRVLHKPYRRKTLLQTVDSILTGAAGKKKARV